MQQIPAIRNWLRHHQFRCISVIENGTKIKYPQVMSSGCPRVARVANALGDQNLRAKSVIEKKKHNQDPRERASIMEIYEQQSFPKIMDWIFFFDDFTITQSFKVQSPQNIIGFDAAWSHAYEIRTG